MVSRKDLKKQAKGVLKRHYVMLVMICLVSSLIGLEFTGTLSGIQATGVVSARAIVETGTTSSNGFAGVWRVLAKGNKDDGISMADEWLHEKLSLDNDGAFGHTRGYLAATVNAISSGSVLVRIYAAIDNVVGSKNVATAVFILLTLAAYLTLQALVLNVYYVISRRMVLESLTYEKVPIQRALYLLRIKKWLRVAVTLLLTGLLQLLWWLTVVGGAVKYYAYCLVPYIVAENPTLTTREAVTLSERLMRGHKWECCKLGWSFMGWELLSAATMGMTGILFSNPYRMTTMAEYYAELRRKAKENHLEGAELLFDPYLFERADEETIRSAYPDIPEPVELPRATGVRGFLANVFGVVLQVGPEELAYEQALEQNARYNRDKLILAGKAYPDRLSPVPERVKNRRQLMELHPMRHYSIWSLLLIFFTFSIVGWLWEVGLHLIEEGELVNRGVLHGPWLPIYGGGCGLILLFLYRFRGKPMVEFLLSVALCGVVEYFTSYLLEVTHDGIKWWDYSGYFLNLHGRICAEGLLIFGLGGLAMVYVLAPLLDNVFRRFPTRRLAAAACALSLVFLCDQAFSARHPNTGRGVTDISPRIQTAETAVRMTQEPSDMASFVWDN